MTLTLEFINIITGAVGGAGFAEVDAILGGETPDQVAKAMFRGAISGGAFGAMATFSVMRPILLIYGMDSGIQSVQESLESGHYAQAAFRAVALVDIVKSLNGEMWEPTSCFTGDTEVDTEAGNKEIKDIQVGDEVYSENPATGEKGLKKVTKLFVREVTELIHVTVGGEEIRTTATHPFWVVGKGWTEAGDLKIGDKLEMYSGEIIEVTDIYAEELATPVKVYNFEVEDWHTYFVSDNGVFVHNACKKPTEVVSNAPKNVYNSIKDAPKYPEGFTPLQNGTEKITVKNKELLSNLRDIEPGEWKKIYKDGYNANGNKISIHYFQSKSGKVFDVDVKSGWSNK